MYADQNEYAGGDEQGTKPEFTATKIQIGEETFEVYLKPETVNDLPLLKGVKTPAETQRFNALLAILKTKRSVTLVSKDSEEDLPAPTKKKVRPDIENDDEAKEKREQGQIRRRWLRALDALDWQVSTQYREFLCEGGTAAYLERQ